MLLTICSIIHELATINMKEKVHFAKVITHRICLKPIILCRVRWRKVQSGIMIIVQWNEASKIYFFLFFNAMRRHLIGCCKSMWNNRQRRLYQDEESSYITFCWIKSQSSFSMFKWNFESNKSVYRAHLKLRCIRFCLDVRTSCSV